jgi:acetate---CoA ligase (ADP-forming)
VTATIVPAGAGSSRLRPLLEPATVAVIGASPTDESGLVGAAVQFGFAGRLYPVNPKYQAIAGLKCYPSVGSIPEQIDVAVVSVRTTAVRSVVEECIASRVRAIIIHTAGFAELGPEGAAEQARIIDLAARAGVPILGPNCQGIVNVGQRTCLSSNAVFRAFPDMEVGSVGLASQSGGVGGIVVAMLRTLGIGISHCVSTGNESDIDVAEVLAYLLEMDDVRVGCAFVEGIRNPSRWRSLAARAVELGKRIVVLHGGTTVAGAKASQSHTASLAGSQEATHAFLEQLGFAIARDLSELVAATSSAVAYPRLPPVPNVLVIANAGGVGVLLADECQRQGLSLVTFARETEDELRKELPSFVVPNNPLDVPLLIGRDPDFVRRVLAIIARDPEPPDVAIVCLHSVFDARWGAAFDVSKTMDGLLAAQSLGGPHLLCIFVSGDADILQIARSRGLNAFGEMTTALGGLATLGRSRMIAGKSRAGADPESRDHPVSGERGPIALSEVAAKTRLRAAGLTVPRGGVAPSAKEAADLAETIGFPVVVKLSSPHLTHKSDAGAVRLRLQSRTAVEEATREVLAAGEKALAGLPIEGVLVEEMVTNGIEMIVGVRRDPNLGPVLLLGLGGIYVEVFRRYALRVLPLSADELRQMITEADFYPILAGARGRPKADIDALVTLLLHLSDYVIGEGADIVELDLNPVLVRPDGLGVSVLDALAMVDGPKHRATLVKGDTR